MGDRVSIQFKRGKELSVVLFDHWGGMGRVTHAQKYADELKMLSRQIGSMPLGRREPQTVMVDYIRDITFNLPRVESSLYIGATENDGDNSDNGHHVISLD